MNLRSRRLILRIVLALVAFGVLGEAALLIFTPPTTTALIGLVVGLAVLAFVWVMLRRLGARATRSRR